MVVEAAEGQVPVSPTETGYTFNKNASSNVKEIMEKDKEDESLQRYKEQLLGSALTSKSNDPRKVVLLQFIVSVSGKEDMIFNIEESTIVNFEMKEGAEYKIRIGFKIQHEIVSGLQLEFKAWKKLLKVASSKEKVVMGSFGPKAEEQMFEFPRHQFLEAPKGMLGRGDYKGLMTLTDVDGNKHVDLKFSFKITK